jgi:hypothetical protein
MRVYLFSCCCDHVSCICFFPRKYTGDLETKGSPAWIVTCGSLLQHLTHCGDSLKKTPRDHDQTFFCITSEDYSKRMHADDQRHRKIICASDEDEVKFRIAFQVGTQRIVKAPQMLLVLII